MNNTTDRNFWKSFWETKKDVLIKKIDATHGFYDVFEDIINNNDVNDCLEIGGFPAHYSIMLKKSFNIDAYLLDFYIHEGILEEVLKINDFNHSDLNLIEADLFTHIPTQKFDFVFSLGFIEHFNEAESVCAKHMDYIKDGGHLFITLPNFRGINGWVNKTFDRAVYDTHVINTMKLDVLDNICKNIGLKDYKISYYGRSGVWLENWKKRSIFIVLLIKTINTISRLITNTFRFESRLFSPFIVITGKK